MTKLSDTQREVLARRDRCLYPLPAKLKGGALAKVAGSLLTRAGRGDTRSEGSDRLAAA